MASDKIKLGGLWKNQDKNGNDYFSGGFTYGSRLLVMKNTFKKSEKEPDFHAYLVPKKDDSQDSQMEDEAPF